MKKTLAVAAVVAATMVTGCQHASNAQNFPLGPVLGGVAGGFIGNQFGKGNGKAAATALGAVGGVLLGQQLQRPVQNQAPSSGCWGPCNPTPVPVVVTSCDAYQNAGARAACNRGVADRKRAEQRAIENQAYRAGRGN